MKDNNEVISEFNEFVNMTAAELEKWLKSDDSNSAGWTKDGGEGESVGHDSGRKIVEILKANPDKDPEKYTDDQLAHMRKVASYCKRHLAQESAGNSNKDEEELKETKSYISLKNWGHDFLKGQGKGSGFAKNGGKSGSKKKEKDDDEDMVEADGDAEAEVDDDGEEQDKAADKKKKAGDKRKKSGQQKGPNKKQETRKTRSSTKDQAENGDDDAKGEEDEDEGEDDEDEGADGNEKGGNGGKSSKKGPKKGDTVSWSWGSGNPKGKVLDVKEDKATITTKNGNKVSRDGNPDDPAVVLDAGKSKAIKSAHELN